METVSHQDADMRGPGQVEGPHNRDALRTAFERASRTMTRLEAIVSVLDKAIDSGLLPVGTRLPTVRMFSTDLKVSPSTVLAAYNVLSGRGRISGEVGRGTFVLGTPAQREEPPPANARARVSPPWRRRAVVATSTRLLEAYPHALDCTRGKPDTSLLLTDILKRAIAAVPQAIQAEDIQYAGSEPLSELRDALLPRLRRDGIPTAGTELVVGTSAQQLMVMALSVVARLMPSRSMIVAVEEPGYQTVFDAFEHAGFRLVGLALDQHGVIPESLNAALEKGALAALFTPSALNPVGVSWTRQRRAALARVLEAHPHAIAIEDDQFADLALTRPGSLLDGKVTGDRTIYIRTFAKSIVPDLRVAVAIARPHLAAQLAETKSLWDGWTSRLSQRILAEILDDPGLETALDHARQSYRSRREIIAAILAERLSGKDAVITADDGLNIWIRLPTGATASEVVERAAALGVLVISGEPFHIRPGHNDAVRMSVSGISNEQAPEAAQRLAEAILASTRSLQSTIPV